MNLSDALDGNWPSGGNQSGGGGMWPTNNNPTWPGNPSQPPNPTWPGPGSGGGAVWPGGNPGQPSWPSQPSQPSAPGGWPSPAPGPGPGPGPGPAPSQPSWPSQPSQPFAPQRSLNVPYTHSVQSGFHDKLMIVINGVITHNPNMFTVDLCAGSDIVFHFNPRFNEKGRQVIVRNSCLNQKWGAEERELSHFPFAAGQPFAMKILCTNEEFKVAVNSSHLLGFKHRMKNLSSIRSFGIYNDVTLSDVRTEIVP